MRDSIPKFGLAGSYYTSPAIYQQELERIFYDQWLCAGRGDQIGPPGSFVQCEIGSESVLIVRGSDDRLRAFHNICRHRGSRLCRQTQGRLAHSIQCHYHAWTYALDGRLIGAPHMSEDRTFDKEQFGLLPVHLREWEGFVFINLGGDPTPFDVHFAPLMGKFARWQLPRLREAGAIDYEVAANWKLIFENYNECYHCPLVHPALASRSPYRSGQNDLQEGPFLGGPMQLEEALGSLTVSGTACAPIIGGIQGADLQQVYYYSIFPNLLVSLHPDYVMMHTVWPRGTDRSLVRCAWLFAPESFSEPAFNPDDAIHFWDETNRQDWEVCEATHLGVSSRAYVPGPFSPLESIPAAFDQEYLCVLGEIPSM